MIATCLRLTFDGIVRGSSGQRMTKSRLSMAVMIAGHQPKDSSGYFAMTYEPTRSVSQGLGGAAVAFSALPVDAATGVAALGGLLSGEAGEAATGAEEVASVPVALTFVICSDAGFVSVAAVFAGVGEAAPDVLWT